MIHYRAFDIYTQNRFEKEIPTKKKEGQIKRFMLQKYLTLRLCRESKINNVN